MTRRIKKPSPSPAAAQPLLGGQEFSSSTSHGGAPPPQCSSCGELVGGAAAECAAICCCCPCGLVNLFVLAVYKLPKGICRKALRKRRRRVLKNGNDQFAPHGKGGSREYRDELGVLRNGNDQFAPHAKGGSREFGDEFEVELERVSGFSRGNSVILDEDIVALEEEMWAKFYGGGFWRSPSQSQMSEKCDISIVSL